MEHFTEEQINIGGLIHRVYVAEYDAIELSASDAPLKSPGTELDLVFDVGAFEFIRIDAWASCDPETTGLLQIFSGNNPDLSDMTYLDSYVMSPADTTIGIRWDGISSMLRFIQFRGNRNDADKPVQVKLKIACRF